MIKCKNILMVNEQEKKKKEPTKQKIVFAVLSLSMQ